MKYSIKIAYGSLNEKRFVITIDNNLQSSMGNGEEHNWSYADIYHFICNDLYKHGIPFKTISHNVPKYVINKLKSRVLVNEI